MRKILLLTAIACIMQSCTTTTSKRSIHVDISQQILAVKQGNLTIKKVPIETSRKGVGTKLGSNRTPIGNYTVTKVPKHRFGPALRLSGYQGHKRGILLHRDFVRGNGTSGCICPTTPTYMNAIYKLVDSGTPISIKM